jgi:hypothetical protein
MNRLVVCLGTLLLLAVCSYAQTSAPEAAHENSAAASTNSDSAIPASASQSKTQQTPAASTEGFDKPSPRHARVRLGGIAVGGGYAHFSGFYPYPFYDPFYYPFSPVPVAMLWDPFWGYYPPFYPSGYFGPGNGKGELKLSGAPKDATVYVNGAYAGTAEHLKSFWLDPGTYDLAVATSDGRRFQQRIYVLTGKTLKLEAKPMEKPKKGDNL